MLTKKSPLQANSIISLLALLIFLPLLVLGVTEVANVIKSKASGTPVSEITVDTKAVLENLDTDFIHAFAQGGEEATNMIGPIVSEVKALRPVLIRIDHIYDHYDVVSRDGNGLQFNFSKLDAFVNSIIETGAKPVLALSYMPSVIAKDGVVINVPNNWDEWSLVVRRTIEHYSGKNERNFANMYYEVWNEPDLAQFGSWKMYGDKNYVTLYRYAAAGANAAVNVNRFSLGGPSTTGLYETWIKGLASSGLRLDFVSWHTYLLNPERYATDQRNIAHWLLPYPQYALLPRMITEFGFTGAKDNRYNTKFAAAHVAAVFRQIISGNPTYLFSFQLKDGPNQTDGSGGWGLIGHENAGKTKKPRYYVYSFLDQMAGTRLLLKGEQTFVTGLATSSGKSIRVMLVNLNTTANTTETFPVTFTNLDNGVYTYSAKYFLGATPQSTTETVTANTLSKTITLTNTSIVIIEITKQ